MEVPGLTSQEEVAEFELGALDVRGIRSALDRIFLRKQITRQGSYIAGRF